MEKQSVIVINYTSCDFYCFSTSKKWTPFFIWLDQIKAVKNIHYFGLIKFYIYYIYIDTEKIDYLQVLSLWSIFEIFKLGGREQIEKLLAYIPQTDAEDFDRYYLQKWKKKHLKKKKANQPINNPLITIVYNNINYWNIDGKNSFFHGLDIIKAVKGYKKINPKEVHVYIDPQDMNFYSIIDLFRMFDVYRAQGRAQLKQLMPYLPEEYIEHFNKHFLHLWKEEDNK